VSHAAAQNTDKIGLTEVWIQFCLKDSQWLTTGWWFSSGTTVSSTNKTDRHDITEILLKWR
jgi:hypothetical protein